MTSNGVHASSDAYVREYAAADPIGATFMGVGGHDHQMTDYSPDGFADRARLARSALTQVRSAQPRDEAEAVAADVFTERVGLDLEIHDTGLDMAALNMIASPVQDVRMVFDLMPTATTQDWDVIARRLAGVPGALAGLSASLRAASDAGNTAALRQVRRVAAQCETWSGGGAQPFFDTLVAGADGVPDSLRADLQKVAAAASKAYGRLARFLREELVPRAPQR